jgi:hypothetical protein
MDAVPVEKEMPSGGEIGRDVTCSQASCRAKRATVRPLRVRKNIHGGERRRAFVHSTQDRQCKSDGDLCPSCRAGSPCARQDDEPFFHVHWSWHIRPEDALPSKTDILSRPYLAWVKSIYEFSGLVPEGASVRRHALLSRMARCALYRGLYHGSKSGAARGGVFGEGHQDHSHVQEELLVFLEFEDQSVAAFRGPEQGSAKTEEVMREEVSAPLA